MKKKALVFIDTDVAIRHFIKNTTFNKLSEAYEIIYVFNNDKTTDKSSVNTPLDSLGLKNIRYTTVPRRRTGKWYFLFAATVLRQQKGLPNYTARKRQLVQSLGSRNVFLLLILGLPVIYPIFKFIFEQLMGIDSSVRGIIEDERPDIVIHPSVLNGYYINELLLMRRKSGLPLCLLMNSWDNPSAKAVATGIPDFMAVWGEQSKQQALDYMKIPSKNLEIFGAAQFQIYRSTPEESIKELYDFFEVPYGKKIILYAGSGNGDYETKYLKLLDRAVTEKILPNCHVLYRPHPWRGGLGDGEDDFFSIKWENITMDPTMRNYYVHEVQHNTGHVFMADYEISNKLLTVTDAVISPLSTILIESLLKGKPALAFFPEIHHEVHFGIDEVHFSDFLKIPEVKVCLKEENFLGACRELYDQTNDSSLPEILKKRAHFFVDMNKPSYGERLRCKIDQLTDGKEQVR